MMREEGDPKVGEVAADLISRARAGDGNAFRELTEPHHRELQVHCYRMLGSFQDAEDALQNTLLTAWQGLGGFEGRASLRTWLCRIATNRCLDARRAGRGGTLLRRAVRRGPQVRPGADASQRPAGVRGLPARPGRHPPRGPAFMSS